VPDDGREAGFVEGGRFSMHIQRHWVGGHIKRSTGGQATYGSEDAS
jgi:hypothetical protein